MEKKEITIIIPDESKDSEQWFAYCPWCGHKTECTESLKLSCPQCGMPALCLPCGTEIT